VHVFGILPGSTALQDLLLLSARRAVPPKMLLLLAGRTALQEMLPLVKSVSGAYLAR
jgi:hypothetical protein